MFSKITSLLKIKAVAKYFPGTVEKSNQAAASSKGEKPKPPAATTIKTYVSGIKLEDRHDKLKKLIAELKKEKYFNNLYDGMSNAKLIDGEEGPFDEENPVYELGRAMLPSISCRLISVLTCVDSELIIQHYAELFETR